MKSLSGIGWERSECVRMHSFVLLGPKKKERETYLTSYHTVRNVHTSPFPSLPISKVK